MNLANGQYGNIQATSEYLDEEKKGTLQQGTWGSSVSLVFWNEKSRIDIFLFPKKRFSFS